MPENQTNDHEEILRLLRENNELAKDNNRLLRRLYRFSLAGFAFKCLWFAVIIGLPFAIYYYLIAPYFDVFGSEFGAMGADPSWLNAWEAYFPLFAN